jgi:sugar (pentulose or hexulose) kinase
LTRRELFAGLDLGTSSLKGAVVDAYGTVVASAQASYPTNRPSPGRAEQAPTDWIVATGRVLRQLSREAPAERWHAIGLSGMIPTLVTLNGSRRPIGPAITWEDARAEAEGEALRKAIGPDHLYHLTGQWVDGRYLLPMFMWLKRGEPDRAASTASICGAKDYLYLYLTGEPATDPSTASGYGCYELATGTWNPDIAAAAGVATSALPGIVASSATSPIRSEVASALELPEGLPVAIGAADSVLGAVGLGVTEPGQVAYIAGTSTVILEVSDRVQLDKAHRYLVTPLAISDRWGLEMDLLSTGSAMQWLAAVMGLAGGAPELLDLAAGSPPGADGLTFLPYFSSGEQGALWDSSLRGAILGLTLGHKREDLARALLEAIAIETRRCLGVLDETGHAVRDLKVAGMGAESSFFWQLLADATGRVITVPPSSATTVSALGAALIAAQAAGADPSTMHRHSEGAVLLHPNPESASLWADISRRHDRSLAMISGARQ